MKKSFKKLGFVSLAASSVLLGSMNATDLETYAALQKPSHVFGNYAKKSNKGSELSSDSLTQQQAQNTAQSDTTQATAKKRQHLRTPLQAAHQPHQPHQLKKMKQVAVAIRINTPLVELVAHQVQVVALVANTTPLQVAHQLQKLHQPQRHQLVVGTL